MLVLGIDCGTQGLKAVVVDGETGRVVASARRAYGTIRGLPAGASEQHPRAWIRAARAAIREAIGARGVRADRVRALAVSGQQHGMVALDDAGRVLRPAKLWNDVSTAAEAESLVAACGGAAALRRVTGNGMPPGFTAPKVLWLKRAEPRNWARCARVLLPHDYLSFWLTGRMVSEAGDASGTGYFDLRARAWSPAVMSAIDAELTRRVPPIVAPGEVIGVVEPRLANALGLPPGVQVGHGGGDNMMAALGTGNTRPGVVTVSLGTSGTAFAYSAAPVVDPRGEIAAFCDSTGGYLPLVCILACTTSVELTRRALGLSLASLERAAAKSPPGARGALLLPYFGGERMPNLPDATGVLAGLTASSFSRDALARAAFEGPTLGLAYGIARLRRLGVAATEVRLTGGGARSRIWRRICADAFGLPVVALRVDEGAAYGAALCAIWCARLAAGERVSADDVARRFVRVDASTRVEPDAARAEMYRERLSTRESLSLELKPAFARLRPR